MQIENVTRSLCWKKVVEKDDIAIWQKPLNHFNCESLCSTSASTPDPDQAWYTNLETCLTPLPKVSSSNEVAGGELQKWPKRLNAVPPRISRGSVDGVTSEMFQRDLQLWKKRVPYYKAVNSQLAQKGRYRNILDMNAFLGGFAASLVQDPLWVMNVVPVEAKFNTLGAIYERGLIGTYQSWYVTNYMYILLILSELVLQFVKFGCRCEAMSTYPRTYDLIHADSIFTLYKDK